MLRFAVTNARAAAERRPLTSGGWDHDDPGAQRLLGWSSHSRHAGLRPGEASAGWTHEPETRNERLRVATCGGRARGAGEEPSNITIHRIGCSRCSHPPGERDR